MHLTHLDISGAVNLEELHAGSNELVMLDLSQNPNLVYLDCSENNLTSLDLTNNTALQVLRCEHNYLDIQDGSAALMFIQMVQRRTGSLVSYWPQKMRPDFVLNADDVATLTQFANQGDNLAKLGWDLSAPETWSGVQWFFATGEYHVQEVSIRNLALTGHLNLSGMNHLALVSAGNNDLTSIDVSGNDRLQSLFARNAGIHSLNISNCARLAILDIEDNYLNIVDIMDDINIVRFRERASARFARQRVPYDFVIITPDLLFDASAATLTLHTIRFSAEGMIPTSVFMRVNKITESNRRDYIVSDTILLDSSGVGKFSFADTPIVLDMAGNYAEVLVYTDSSW